ncbi:MAG: hypothetical protein M8357_09740 [Desulfobulbaceae bacterium]|nr:hypothetical protein [Desulfobulbaceae bacterium]
MKNQTAEKILDNTFKHLERVLKNKNCDKDGFVDKTALQVDEHCKQLYRKKSGSINREANRNGGIK